MHAVQSAGRAFRLQTWSANRSIGVVGKSKHTVRVGASSCRNGFGRTTIPLPPRSLRPSLGLFDVKVRKAFRVTGFVGRTGTEIPMRYANTKLEITRGRIVRSQRMVDRQRALAQRMAEKE